MRPPKLLQFKELQGVPGVGVLRKKYKKHIYGAVRKMYAKITLSQTSYCYSRDYTHRPSDYISNSPILQIIIKPLRRIRGGQFKKRRGVSKNPTPSDIPILVPVITRRTKNSALQMRRYKVCRFFLMLLRDCIYKHFSFAAHCNYRR